MKINKNTIKIHGLTNLLSEQILPFTTFDRLDFILYFKSLERKTDQVQ